MVSVVRVLEKNVLNGLVFSVGTPERNTVCKRCPDGFFSNETSSKAPCRKHTNCSALGLLLTQKGNATHDNTCSGSSESTHKCGIGNDISKYQSLYHLRVEYKNFWPFLVKFSFPSLDFNQHKAILCALMLKPQLKNLSKSPHLLPVMLQTSTFTLESNLTHGENLGGVMIMFKPKLSEYNLLNFLSSALLSLLRLSIL